MKNSIFDVDYQSCDIQTIDIMVAGIATPNDKNEAYISGAVQAQKEKLRELSQRGKYGRVVVEYVVQDGVIQHAGVETKDQVKIVV